MSERDNYFKLALYGLGTVVLGVSLYYLSREDPQDSNLDSKKFTKDKLRKFLSETTLEFTCIYCRNYNLLHGVKAAKGDLPAEDLEQLTAIIDKEMKDKTRQLCEDFCFNCHPRFCDAKDKNSSCVGKDSITVEQYTNWISMYKNEDFVKKALSDLKQLREDVLVKQKLNHISLQDEVPSEFTKEKYISVYDKIWATIRHDMYVEIQQQKKIDRVEILTQERFNEIYESVHNRFEQIRTEIYELIMDVELPNKEMSREIMQKAYVAFSTLSEDGKKSRWANLVTQASNKHNKYINEMLQGVFYDGIENDPRDSREADSKIDLKSLPGYQSLSSQKTMLADKGRQTVAASTSTDKYVEKMKELAASAKLRVSEKKQQDVNESTEKQSKPIGRQLTQYIPLSQMKDISEDEDKDETTQIEQPVVQAETIQVEATQEKEVVQSSQKTEEEVISSNPDGKATESTA